MRLLRPASFLAILFLTAMGSFAHVHVDPWQVNFLRQQRQGPDVHRQEQLRMGPAWQVFRAAHPRWSVEFNEASGKPHRAFGPGIPVAGSTPEAQAMQFIQQELLPFGIPVDDLVHRGTATTTKFHHVFFAQHYAGLPVIRGELLVKLDHHGRVLLLGLEVHDDIAVDTAPTLSVDQALAVASGDMPHVLAAEATGLYVLPMPVGFRTDHRLVHEVIVRTRNGERPGHYRCWVDAHSGELLYRWNEVPASCHGHGAHADSGADVAVVATVYPNGPLAPTEVVGLADLRVTIGGDVLHTDADGNLETGVPGPVPALFQLQGRWAQVSTNNNTPALANTLQEGPNTVTFDGTANIRQRSAYHSVGRIHDHMKQWLPGFTGMDVVLPTRVDLTTGSCNGFYDGTSINFFAEGNGCRSMALMHDIVYHEYGHGINDKFYQGIGGSFINGAMNEGYADLWALSLTQQPVLAQGFMLNNANSFIRRYDENPKVFPVDLVGQVHADGEIICGAWWDTHVLLGNDMDAMLAIFREAYAGLQATAFNGQEGQAYRDVLIDALQADDDDGDITNGTPNGAAIVQAFAQHGITLLSNAQVQHTGVEAVAQFTPVELVAAVNVFFPFDQYLAGVRAFYRINGGPDWTSVTMAPLAGGVYGAQLLPQPPGTLMAYYLAVEDILGGLSGVRPMGADLQDPNLPFHVLVGFQLEATEDVDLLHQLGSWTTGLPSDNATAGMWEQNEPVPSFSGAGGTGVMVQPGFQHTPGGEFCWVTQNATSPQAPMGEADVDGGSTTILSSIMDLSGYDTPTFTYWRWFVNNPPGGSNPNDDWWQVFISNNGGSTWIPVEETRTSDRSWRRAAFRVQDHVPVTSAMRLKFVASDSVRPGAYLEGASLVEAALDDIQLWQAQASTVGVADLPPAVITTAYPDPASDELQVLLALNGARGLVLDVVDITGRLVLPSMALDAGREHHLIDVRSLVPGHYVLRLRWVGGRADRRFSVLR